MFIGTAAQAADLLAPMFDSHQRELVVVLHLGSGQRLLAVTVEEPGSPDKAELPIREIIAKGLLMGAEGILLAHNHPSGSPEPSAADEAATRALADAAAGVGIRLHDHLIFADGECRSFRALGLI